MKKIKLTQEKFALVDDEDFDYLNQWKWFYRKKKGEKTGYAARSNKNPVECILMHRLINKTPRGKYTDHRDGNGLNNQKYNLRTATSSQNQMNAKSNVGSSSKFKGVCWHKHHLKWISQINIKGKKIHIGTFTSEIDAARAYNAAAKIHHGDFAKLNQGV